MHRCVLSGMPPRLLGLLRLRPLPLPAVPAHPQLPERGGSQGVQRSAVRVIHVPEATRPGRRAEPRRRAPGARSPAPSCAAAATSGCSTTPHRCARDNSQNTLCVAAIRRTGVAQQQLKALKCAAASAACHHLNVASPIVLAKGDRPGRAAIALGAGPSSRGGSAAPGVFNICTWALDRARARVAA